MSDPFAPYSQPFVVPVASAVAPDRLDGVDLYRPPHLDTRAPCIVFVHGPVAEGAPRPRDWPVFRGYGQLAAESGFVAAVSDLDYDDWRVPDRAIAEIADLLEQLRHEALVDNKRIALWTFSAGALIAAPWIADAPPWLRCVALTYPVIAPPDRVSVPLVVTQVGNEQPEVQATVDLLLMVADAQAELITVSGAPPGFDFLDPRPTSEQAVRRAMRSVAALLRC